MRERSTNRTRSGLILLFITVIAVIAVLTGDFVGRVKAYCNDEYEVVKEYDEEGNLYMVTTFNTYPNTFETTCVVSFLGGVVIAILFLGSMYVLLNRRENYGKKHSRNLVTAFILAHVLLLMPLGAPLIDSYFFKLGNNFYFDVTGVVVILLLFLFTIFFSTYELKGKRCGIIAIIIGALSTVPMFFLKYYSSDGLNQSDIRADSRLLMITDVGLIIAMIFFLIAIRKALEYIKDNSLNE